MSDQKPDINDTNNTSMQYFVEQAKAAKYDKIKNVPDIDKRTDNLLEYLKKFKNRKNHNEPTKGGRKKSFRKTNRKRKSRRRTNRRRTNRRR